MTICLPFINATETVCSNPLTFILFSVVWNHSTSNLTVKKPKLVWINPEIQKVELEQAKKTLQIKLMEKKKEKEAMDRKKEIEDKIKELKESIQLKQAVEKSEGNEVSDININASSLSAASVKKYRFSKVDKKSLPKSSLKFDRRKSLPCPVVTMCFMFVISGVFNEGDLQLSTMSIFAP